MKTSAKRGFTLIELLLVIGIIAILAAIVIVAINPTRQLGQARDAQRRSDVNTILNAIYQYAIDNNGNLPCQRTASSPCVDTSVRMLGTQTSGCSTSGGCTDITVNATGCLDLGSALTSDYLVSMPTDPQGGIASSTLYVVQAGSDDRVTVTACTSEQSGTIQVTR